MKRVIIAGGRDYTDFEKMCSVCDEVLKEYPIEEVEIVSGTAGGADKLGERYARERGYAIKEFPAKWGEFGRAAGHIRNGEMGEYSNELIAFWDGTSKGTKNMISIAKKLELKTKISYY